MSDYDCIEDEVIEELRREIRRINALLSGELPAPERERLREDRRGLSEDLAALRRAA